MQYSMKVLYIDNIGPIGHIVFNQIQTESLNRIGCKVDAIYDIKYKGRIQTAYLNNVFFIEPYFKKAKPSPIDYRTNIIRQYFSIVSKNKVRDYDAVVISHFDPMAIFAFRTFCHVPVYCFVHNPIETFNNKIKVLASKLSIVNNFIVFNEEMKQTMLNIGFKNTCVVSHGYDKPFTHTELDFVKIGVPQGWNYVLCPSATSTDYELLKTVLDKTDFIRYCNESRIKIVVKASDNIDFMNENVIKISGFIETPLYESLMKNTLCAILVYGKEFKSRVSGIMFECMSNQIPCAYYHNSGFDLLSQHFNYKPSFEVSEDLIQVLDCIRGINSPYCEVEDILPDKDWKSILKL